jgi:phosphonate transport system substrate-binding protein
MEIRQQDPEFAQARVAERTRVLRVRAMTVLVAAVLLVCTAVAVRHPSGPSKARASVMAGGPSSPQPSKPTATDERPVIRFGIPPWQKGVSVDEVRGLYTPMLEWLGEQIEYRIIVVGSPSYERMIDMVAQGAVQLAVLSPVPYVQARRRNPALELIVTETKWNETQAALTDSYTGYIVSLKSRSDINALEDLRDRRFAFVNLESSSGYRVPNAIMRQNAIDYRTFFRKTFFLGSHPRVTDAVAEGSVDAAATWDYNFDQAIAKHGGVFKIIHRTPPIPNPCVVAHPSLPAPVRERIRENLLKIDPRLLEGSPARGYTVRPDSFYDAVRTLVDKENAETGH